MAAGEHQSERGQADASPGAAPHVLPPGHRSLAELGARLLFEKVMTTCDVSEAGRIVVPKVLAVDRLPSQLWCRIGASPLLIDV